MNKIFLLAMILVLGMLEGCALNTPIERISVASVENAHKLAKNNSGILFGLWLTDAKFHQQNIHKVCEAIKNNDPRCANQNDYILGMVVPAYGAYAGKAVVLTLISKDMKLSSCDSPQSGTSDCTYLKVKAEKGKIGTVIEIASAQGDGKCKWSGANRIGGTICPAYNWSYEEELRDYDAANFFTGNDVLIVPDK